MDADSGLRRVAGSPVERILERLDRVRGSGRGWTARCPAHEDRWPSLSIAEGTDGRALLYCHSGCRFGDVIKALELDAVDAFPPSESGACRAEPRRAPGLAHLSQPASRVGAGGSPSPIALPRSVAAALVENAHFAETWEVAKQLAKLPSDLLREDMLRNWDCVTELFDVPALLRLTYLVRGVALFRYCNANNASDPAAVRRAVERLIEELDRKERAA